MHMANCRGPCESVDRTSLEWFKIQESGLLNATKNAEYPYSLDSVTNSTSGTWAVDELVDGGGNYTVQTRKYSPIPF